MAIIASYVADKIRKSGKLTTTQTRKIFTTVAVLIPGLFMIIQAIWGMNALLSVTVFTAALFFNGAVTAGYLANGLDIAPNFSGTIFGLANTLSSCGGWFSTKLVALITGENSTFSTWKYIFWIMMATYCFGALFYLIFGTGNLQKFNGVERAEENGKELQPLKNTENERDKADIA